MVCSAARCSASANAWCVGYSHSGTGCGGRASAARRLRQRRHAARLFEGAANFAFDLGLVARQLLGCDALRQQRGHQTTVTRRQARVAAQRALRRALIAHDPSLVRIAIGSGQRDEPQVEVAVEARLGEEGDLAGQLQGLLIARRVLASARRCRQYAAACAAAHHAVSLPRRLRVARRRRRMRGTGRRPSSRCRRAAPPLADTCAPPRG